VHVRDQRGAAHELGVVRIRVLSGNHALAAGRCPPFRACQASAPSRNGTCETDMWDPHVIICVAFYF
jgi:hypothetical protein